MSARARRALARPPPCYDRAMVAGYRSLMDDPTRIAAVQAAVEAVVRPGDVVTEIGCGLGTFSIFACRAGASRVYAVEQSNVLDVTREVVSANGCDDRITLIPGQSTDVDVPERANVVIYEDYIDTLLSAARVRVLADIRRRWLVPGGVLLPPRGREWLVSVEDPEGFRNINRFSEVHDEVCGVDLAPTTRRALSTWYRRRPPTAAMITPPVLLREVELLSMTSATHKATATATASRTSLAYGLLLWYELQLGATWLGTAPGVARTAWGDAVLFPFAEPLPIAAGEALSMRLEASQLQDDLVWRWRLDARAGSRSADSLEGGLRRPDLTRLGTAGHVPVAGRQLALDRAILEAVDGIATIEQIASRVAERFTDELDSVQAARERVVAVLGRYPVGATPR